jgi:hypothetical protein
MAHCINAFIVRKDDINIDRLKTITDSYVELEKDLVLISSDVKDRLWRSYQKGTYGLLSIETKQILDHINEGNSLHLLLRLILNKENLEFLWISTDYFGGFGEQTCYYGSFFDEKVNKIADWRGDEFNPDYYGEINRGLRALGVTRCENSKGENLDEFDTVGLGKYRSNEDIVTL